MPRWWTRRRFDVVEVGWTVLFVALVAWGLGRARPVARLAPLAPEAAWLAATYGPQKHSENEEEWIVRDFFKDRREGFFVDVGANHYKTFSNTYFLETERGWSGVAVDPQARFEADYARYRPRTRFFALFVSDTSTEPARMYVLDHAPLVTSGTREFTERWGGGAREIIAPTITLTELLDRLRVSTFELLSVDVELSEPRVLAGFEIERFRPALVCIEAHPEVRQPILDYFARHGYVAVGRYLRADTKNLYFAPLR